jgi:cytochrome c biogenesis protein CcmG/thiol:disulfide interchange protein DsbE
VHAGNVAWAERTVTVDTIDSAGIARLIKTSDEAVIVAMAAWCLPCRAELPVLVKMYNKYKSQGLRMVGISLDPGGPSAIKPILDRAHVNFPVYWAGEKVAYDLRIQAIPLLLLIKNGSIIERILGQIPEVFLDKKLNDLLK